jgi:NitT/TauT family transport system substrate-binding protein
MDQHRSRAAFLACAAAAAAWSSLSTLARAAEGSTPLRAASSGDDDATPFLYAVDRGLFRQAGIDAHLDRAASGSAVAAGVVGGAYDVGKSSLVALITAHAHGVPVTLVAPAGEYDQRAPVAGLLVKSDGPIHTAADLNGKIVAVSSLNDLYAISTRAWVDKHGGDSRTLRLIELPISAVPEALEQGRIDAGNVLEPHLRFATQSGKARVLAHPFDAIAPQFLYSAWFTMKDTATKNRVLLERVARVIHDAAVYANGHHGETAAALAAFTKVDPQVIATSTRSTAGTVLDPKEIQPVIDAAASYKAIPAPFDARELIDPAFAHSAT